MASNRTIRILSAGAPKTGVRKCAEAFAAETGLTFEVEFATAPVLRERVESGSADADLVIAPVAAMADFAEAGHVIAATASQIGSVTAGVAVRNGAPAPDLSTIDTLIEALLGADAVVYNEASSGQYIARMIEDLDLAHVVAPKTVRVPTGAAVMQHLANSSGFVIGFGQITEIRLHENLGIHLVGPLPKAVNKVTTYAAAVLTSAALADPARRLVNFMTSDSGREIFASTGVV